MSIVQIYARLIKEGRRTLESVPETETIRAEVETALNEGAEQQ